MLYINALVETSPPANEEIGAMGREIEYLQIYKFKKRRLSSKLAMT
jgi:hypothetical protein